MKKLPALLLACILLLSLGSAAAAEPDALRIECSSAELNCYSNVISVKQDSFCELISADGQVLVPDSEQYSYIFPKYGEPYFTTYVNQKAAEDSLHRKGLLAGDGKLLVPAKYADVRIFSDRWQAGHLVRPCREGEEEEYTVHNLYTGITTPYCVDAADIYFDGMYVGTLSREEYGKGIGAARGAYLGLKNPAGEYHFYNRDLEQSPFEAKYLDEYRTESQGGTTIYYHQGTGQIAFQPECTLDPADLETPYCYDSGVVYNIRGEVLFETEAYDFLDFYSDGYALTSMGRKTGLISLSGQLLIPAEYDYLGYYEEHILRFGYISAENDELFGFLDAEGRISVPLEYPEDDISNYCTFATMTDPDGSILVISAAVGQLPLSFAEVDFPSRDGCMAFVGTNADGQYGVFDLYGRELLPFSDSYESVEVSVDGSVALVSLGNGVYDIYRFDFPERSAPEEAG